VSASELQIRGTNASGRARKGLEKDMAGRQTEDEAARVRRALEGT
jgi:hypothetical protein